MVTCDSVTKRFAWLLIGVTFYIGMVKFTAVYLTTATILLDLAPWVIKQQIGPIVFDAVLPKETKTFVPRVLLM